MTSTYAWVITRDHLESKTAEPGAALVSGPSGAADEQISSAMATGYPFIIKNDDGETYYSGYCWTADPEFGDEDLFGPLNDYGMPNAGATDILYREHGGRTGKYTAL
jgi:hypothetical protein